MENDNWKTKNDKKDYKLDRNLKISTYTPPPPKKSQYLLREGLKKISGIFQ